MENILQYIINLIVFVPIILLLIVISIKLSKASLLKTNNTKYTQVIERTNLNKDTDLFVIKIGDEGCVLVSSPYSTDKVKELSKEDIANIEELKRNQQVNLSNKKLNFNGGKHGRLH